MMRCLSALASTASTSFAAEDLIRILYSATPLQTLDERVEGQAALILSVRKRLEILGVFGQSGFYRIIDHIRDRAIHSRSSEPQSAVHIGFEVNSGAFLRIHACHYDVVTLRRQQRSVWLTLAPGFVQSFLHGRKKILQHGACAEVDNCPLTLAPSFVQGLLHGGE